MKRGLCTLSYRTHVCSLLVQMHGREAGAASMQAQDAALKHDEGSTLTCVFSLADVIGDECGVEYTVARLGEFDTGSRAGKGRLPCSMVVKGKGVTNAGSHGTNVDHRDRRPAAARKSVRIDEPLQLQVPDRTGFQSGWKRRRS